MADESFDYEELESIASQPTVTAWASQVARPRVTRTYGRRGSTGVLPRKVKPTFASHQDEEPLEDITSPSARAENEFGQLSEIESSSLPIFKPDAPKVPGRRRFTRANSMETTSSSAGKRPPILKRSMSVSDSSVYSGASSARTRTSSFSSGLDSFSSGGVENFHPNHSLEPLEELASPKRSALQPLEVHGRKKSRSSSVHHRSSSLSSSSSFSNLARGGEPSSLWGKASPLPKADSSLGTHSRLTQSMSDFNELEFLESSSPDISSVGSTRKRGICESPLLEHLDDYSIGNIAPMPQRSRLFSPPSSQLADFQLESVEKFKVPGQGIKYSKKTDLVDIASDDGSGIDTTDSDDDASMGGVYDNRRSPVPTFVPFDQRQNRKVSVPVVVKATAPNPPLDPSSSSVDDVINTMSSYQDLKYLTKALQKQSAGGICWHVALPSKWEEAQRRGFILWITSSLGFTYRKAGGLTILQIPRSKGVGLCKLLEKALLACKKRGLGGKSPTNANVVAAAFFGTTSPAKPPLGLNVSVFPMEIAEETNDLDLDLMNAMKSLDVKEMPAHVEPVQNTIEHATVVFEDLNDVASHAPRHSIDHHASSHDLMAHMHGLTPIPKMPSRPPRLSTGSVATQGTVSKFSAASPFHTASTNTGNTMQCMTHEFVETPMMKPAGWGSCPVEGRDWGTSNAVQDTIIQELVRMLDQTLVEAGAPLMDEGGSSRTFSLDLDFAKEGAYRTANESSPESTSRRDDNFEDVLSQQDVMLDTSPSSQTGIDHTMALQAGRGAIDNRTFKRRQTAFEKRKRMSLFASAVNPAEALFKSRQSLFTRPSRTSVMPRPSFLLEQNLTAEHKFGLDIPMEAPPYNEDDTARWHEDDRILQVVFGFLSEPELLRSVFLVNNKWADAATHAHAVLMLSSVGCRPENILASGEEVDDDESDDGKDAAPTLLDRSWDYLTTTYPWARFLAEGGFKAVFKVFNRTHKVEEAMSIMNIDLLRDSGEMNVVGMELAVSVMLSSLVRRGVCPNFVMTRGAFSSSFRPPASFWGSEENKCPKGDEYLSPVIKKKIRQPKQKGRYQYIRMELCDKGDAEEYMKTLSDERFDPMEARQLLFQMAYALHTAAIKISLKHYDVKLLNYFIQSLPPKQTGRRVLRYQLGVHTFALDTVSGATGHLAKLADYGTANVDATSNGQPVTLAQITTPENTPMDYMILGDSACQGHGHDNFGLGLCMLHLYTGHAPYEEILEQVKCPSRLKKRLQELWECGLDNEFSVIQAHVLHNVDKDETGHILEGEPDEVLYHTFYRFLVLFGLPSEVSARVRASPVWAAVLECLDAKPGKKKGGKGKRKTDVAQYNRDCRKYSIDNGTNEYIARARSALQAMDGGMELLKSLVSFDSEERFTALDAMNSTFMAPLREHELAYGPDDDVRTYTIALN